MIIATGSRVKLSRLSLHDSRSYTVTMPMQFTIETKGWNLVLSGVPCLVMIGNLFGKATTNLR